MPEEVARDLSVTATHKIQTMLEEEDEAEEKEEY